MELYEKLKEIRIKLLIMNQYDLALAFDATQKDISNLENGKKKLIPKRYLEYLAKEGIDLNSLFHPEEKVFKREEFSSSQESGSSQKSMEALYGIRDFLNKIL